MANHLSRSTGTRQGPLRSHREAPSQWSRRTRSSRCAVALSGRSVSASSLGGSFLRLTGGATAHADSLSPPTEAAQTQALAGSLIALVPFVVATYEFSKRIVMQRRCARCSGDGLIKNFYGYDVKCDNCGGFLPWKDWRLFLRIAPGNGGPLQQPRGQDSVLYDVDKTVERSKQFRHHDDE